MKARITPTGAVVLLVLAAGVVLVSVASGTAVKVGWVLVFLTVAFMAADRLPAGLTGGFFVGRGPARRTSVNAEPEYIERAATPSQHAWRREEQHYRGKNISGRAG